jgi:hypothetical protein
MLKKLLLAIGLLVVAPAFAAVSPNSFVTPQTPNRGAVSFVGGTDAPFTYKTLYTAGANGSRCYGIFTSNTDSVTHVTYVELVTGGGITVNGVAVTPAASAGAATGVPPVNMMSPAVWPGLPVDQYGNPYIQLASGDVLKATYASTLTSATIISVYSSCSDF